VALTTFADWLQTPRGRYLLAWEQRQFDCLVADIFGFHALQVGLCSVDLLRANRMSCRLHCGSALSEVGSTLYAVADELPFASQSVDLVVLPHVLEFAAHPHQILREVERILVPEGHVLIAGFNPFSLWGVRRALAGNLGDLPWQGQYLSLRRLKDWLSLLGFEARSVAQGCFAPPVASEVWLRRWSFMDAVGERFWSVGGSTYILQAVKRVQGMRLITPKWREAQRRQKAMAPVAQQTSGNPWKHPR
jgi:SAM-dependent methyltransferase